MNGNLFDNNSFIDPQNIIADKQQSHRFKGTSFAHIKNDTELCNAIENLLNNGSCPTYPSIDSDALWMKTEAALLQALCLYVKKYFSEHEHNLEKVMFVMRKHEAKQLDELMETERTLCPDGLIAFKYFEVFKKKACLIEKSIVVTCAVRINRYIEKYKK